MYPCPVFVTLEGPEGAGKSTVARQLAATLEEQGHKTVLTREPGSGQLGQQIRALLLESDGMSQTCELFLFLADRAQHVESLVRPALAAGSVVLCDRYADSTIVYQGHARGHSVEELTELNSLATGGLKPDVTLLLDLDPELGLARLESKDRLDSEPLEFHQKVRQGFLAEAKKDPERWVIIDASGPAEDVFAACWSALRAQL